LRLSTREFIDWLFGRIRLPMMGFVDYRKVTGAESSEPFPLTGGIDSQHHSTQIKRSNACVNRRQH
jgi:hypothetical protein